MDPLAPLLADGVIDEIIARLKSGKEADVYLVRHGAEIVAAKVYKARHARNFKNNAAYKEGRQVRDTRTQRAMDRGSRFGQAAAEEAWKTKESDALHKLHAAGIRVPQPVMFYEGVLLMEVVVDADGRPAPRLVDAPIAPEQAAALYADLRRQAIGMLACDLIHGDLSPYNVLVGWNGPVVIDFPQVVGAAHNSQAESFFLRDLENLRRFFAALDPALGAAEGDGREIWRAYVRRELAPDFVPTGRSPEGHRPRSPDQRAHRQEGPRHADDGAPHRGGARPEPQRDRSAGGAPRSPSRHPSSPSGPARPSVPQPGSHAGPRRGPDRSRRDAPMPEVIRVGRPPLGPAGSSPAPHGTPHRSVPASTTAPSAHPKPHPSSPPHAGATKQRPPTPPHVGAAKPHPSPPSHGSGAKPHPPAPLPARGTKPHPPPPPHASGPKPSGAPKAHPGAPPRSHTATPNPAAPHRDATHLPAGGEQGGRRRRRRRRRSSPG
jgi:RIO kinase 1